MYISGPTLLCITILVGRSIAAPILIEQSNEIHARAPPTTTPTPEGKFAQAVTAVKTVVKIKAKFKPKKDEAIFWAGRRPGNGPEGIVSLEHDARRIAKEQGKSTLEDHLERHNIHIPPAEQNRHSVRLWDIASKTFAQRAKGETHAYLGTYIRPQSVYTNKEKPILMKSKRITKITEHDVHHGTSRVVKGQKSPSRSRSGSRGRSPARAGSPSGGRSTSHGRAPSHSRSTSRSRSPSRGRSPVRSGTTSRSRSPSSSRTRSNSPARGRSPTPRKS